MMKKSVILLLLTLSIIGAGGVFAWKKFSIPQMSPLSRAKVFMTEVEPLQKVASIIPQPSPVPFAEITIPGLRSRAYQSTLGEFRKVGENSRHTKYTTSYDSDGFRVNALLTQPKEDQPSGGWPAIVFVHGYIPPTQYETLTRYVDHVNYLADRGYVVLKIDLRGHGDSEGEPGGAYYSGDYVVDTLNARAALQSSNFVNPNKIGLWGHSMAGNVTFRSLVAQPEIPAVVIWGGAVYTYTDLQEFGIDDNSYRPPATTSPTQERRRLLMETHGEFNAESKFWQQVIPTHYLQEVQGQVQIHHAKNDNVVSIEFSRNLVNILKNTSIPHELYEYDGGGHNLTSPAFTPAMQRTVEFYDRTLKN